MNIKIYETKTDMSREAAMYGAGILRKTILDKGYANVIFATAPSQFEMMSFLIQEPDIDWSKVTIFHLDEYIHLPADHIAGFRLNLRKNLIDQLPQQPAKVYFVDGDNPETFCADMKKIMSGLVIDLAFIGVGENGHLAFNDPPADFDTDESYKIVALDEVCRNQQYTEGWFPTLDAVPTNALTMSIPQILKARAIVNVVPDARKAEAIKGMVEGPLTNLCPASVLRNHPNCVTFLDKAAASLLK
ncbi:MAG: glucosamine-6-phosphate deaminase [Lentisphaeria bacterium]|nr:glucosamine-6-phosphate deaminase [Lentisphaeria bacterium]